MTCKVIILHMTVHLCAWCVRVYARESAVLKKANRKLGLRFIGGGAVSTESKLPSLLAGEAECIRARYTPSSARYGRKQKIKKINNQNNFL